MATLPLNKHLNFQFILAGATSQHACHVSILCFKKKYKINFIKKAERMLKIVYPA